MNNCFIIFTPDTFGATKAFEFNGNINQDLTYLTANFIFQPVTCLVQRDSWSTTQVALF